MGFKELSSGFLVTDLKDSKISSGLVRVAPKILRYGGEQLARAATYMFALHKLEVAGASAAINSKPETRTTHISKFITETSDSNFLPDAGKGITHEELAGIKDSRSPIRLTEIGGQKLYQYCIGVSAVATIDELLKKEHGGLEGKSVAIEGFGSSAYGTLKSLEDAGAKIVGVSNQKDFAYLKTGFDISILAEGWEKHGEGFLSKLESDQLKPAEEIFSDPFIASVEVLFVGSKMGVIDHTMELDIKALASLHPIPYTTKALIALDRKNVIVPPDFLCLGGQLAASWAEPSSPEEAIENAEQKAKELANEISAASESIADGPKLFLAACKMAEDFLKSWQDELPFGRAIL